VRPYSAIEIPVTYIAAERRRTTSVINTGKTGLSALRRT
jgi:hypothetical protein